MGIIIGDYRDLFPHSLLSTREKRFGMCEIVSNSTCGSQKRPDFCMLLWTLTVRVAATWSKEILDVTCVL